jgi:lipid II:glycine glycyltransferase (peptidoglycan interpeptide bridge formation enzyme)
MPVVLQSDSWNQALTSLSDPHLLQTWEWGQFKARFGWKPFYLTWSQSGEPRVFHEDAAAWESWQVPVEAAALVLQRTIPIQGFAATLRVMYVPKGPLLLDWSSVELRERVLMGVRNLGQQQGAIFIKIDPDVCLGKGLPETNATQVDCLGEQVANELKARGWKFSAEQVQFRNTVMVDLAGSEETLLARMKPKTRYNIRLAQRKGVTVRTGGLEDLTALYRMYAETSVRDGFTIRDESYYHDLWQTFMTNTAATAGSDRPYAQVLIAEVSGEAVAALFLFYFSARAWYLFGMSRAAHREKMPNHLLQWEAMRQARSAGCRVYDLWGAPDEFVESDPLWGVYRFKEGLGGEVVRHLGAWDLPLRPFYYRLYTQVLPRILNIMRQRGRARTERMASL